MKWIVSLLALVAVQVASSSASVIKRVAASDVATIGYASLNGGTSGGSGGTTTTVTTLTALTAAVSGTAKKIVIISGTITGDAVVDVGSNTTVLGKAGATLQGIGLRVLNVQNVIIRNLIISKVLAPGDNIGIQASSQVWVDHVDLSSDRDHDKDYYDGALDITHGCFGITVTNSKLHDHWKTSLIGHSDNNGAQDVAIRVSLANNWWRLVNSRTPSFRFGTGHIWNNYYDSNGDGINTRDAAQLLVENNVWYNCTDAIYATDAGFAVARGNDYGGLNDSAPVGTFTTAPYTYSLLAATAVKASVTATAGATLSF